MRGVSAAAWARVVLVSFAALACATEPSARLQALRSDASVRGSLAPDAILVLVWADTPALAWGRIVQARTEAPLEESALLARAFTPAAVRDVEVAVGGPHAMLSEQVLIDAFRLTERDRLPGLRLIYVSPDPPGEKLVEICERRTVRLEHRFWRGNLD